MAHPKAIVGLSLLCVMAVSALVAPSAPAAFTTAGECVKGGGAKDYKDAHCTEPVTEGTGSYGHVLFANGVKKDVTITNVGTGLTYFFRLEGKLIGVPIVIDCKGALGTTTVTNEAGGKLTYGNAELQLSKCEMNAPAACSGKPVAIPKIVATLTGVHNLKISTATKENPTGEKLTFHEENAAATGMGLKFAPAAGGTFAEISLTCPLEAKIPLKGFAYATPHLPTGGSGNTSGATATFTEGSSIAGLTFGGGAATLEGVLTFYEESDGTPLIVTTTE
jgi:hypothetical protein